jgi:hypothetical protein
MKQKADAAEIEALMRDLARAPWLGEARASWPLHLFRSDDVQAAASILNGGVIYSRLRAQEFGVLTHDSASPSVIEHSPEWCKRCVRLYFRPRTPTEYQSEGFRPSDQLPLGAHRPMPVVMVFDAIPVITAAGAIFTDGNAAKAECKRGSDAVFLRTIPFEKVYHVGPVAEPKKREIIFRRCAEVLVEDEVTLDKLRRIYCRSQAEYETLMGLLSSAARARHAKRLGVSAGMHYRLWTFVESAALSQERVHLRFSPSTRTPGPFKAEAQILVEGRVRGTWRDDSYQADSELVLSLRGLRPFARAGYRVVLTLDGSIAYANTFMGEEALM